jgi:hypothetical protein
MNDAIPDNHNDDLRIRELKRLSTPAEVIGDCGGNVAASATWLPRAPGYTAFSMATTIVLSS